MENYRKLAVRYLNMNKKRNIITIFGVVVTTMLLFMFLNICYSLLVNEQKKAREASGDYEIVLFLESEEQGQQILGDKRIKNAYIGPYYDYVYPDDDYYQMPETQMIHANALYVSIPNPYRTDAVFEQLCTEYNVEGTLNDYLAATYGQGDGLLLQVLILTVLLIAYIFAIFGVGIVRNSIQLCALENIRDYGNLRCIGASKGQLKELIYLQGAILELAGIAIGCIIGFTACKIVGAIVQIDMVVQPLSILLIMVLFLADLYFTMGENSKLITGMSPVSAIRGEYRIRKEKIKLRENNLFGKLFGVEGDYAYKSLMRNKGRFFRTITVMIFGIGMFIGIAGAANSLNRILKDREDSYEYYQIYFENRLNIEDTIELVQSSLPSTKNLAEFSELDEVTEAKRSYGAEIWLVDVDTYNEKITEDFRTMTDPGLSRDICYETYLTAGDGEEDRYLKQKIASSVATVECYGYDESDMKRYESALVDGTLDISDQGIIIVNQGHFAKAYEVTESLGVEYIDTAITSYQVGDTIEIVDMKKFRNEVQEGLEPLELEYEQEQLRLEQELADDKSALQEALDDLNSEINSKKRNLVYDIWQSLIQNGDYQTYTIEGIVNEDVNRSYWDMRIILPKEQYFAITGTDETMNTGMMYHLDSYPKNSSRIEEIFGDAVGQVTDKEEMCEWSYYVWEIGQLNIFKRSMGYVVLVVVFIVLMSALNFINATASNLHLRRKEFAQLRVIGTSRDRLMKMVLLEGVIMTVVSNVFGILLGTGISFGVFQILTMTYGIEFSFPIVATIGCMLVSILLLCGAIYVPMRNLSQSMVGDLTTGGD